MSQGIPPNAHCSTRYEMVMQLHMEEAELALQPVLLSPLIRVVQQYLFGGRYQEETVEPRFVEVEWSHLTMRQDPRLPQVALRMEIFQLAWSYYACRGTFFDNFWALNATLCDLRNVHPLMPLPQRRYSYFRVMKRDLLGRPYQEVLDCARLLKAPPPDEKAPKDRNSS